jgi:hydroxyethylthiazole kinase-like uncharacterized protein yjeF
MTRQVTDWRTAGVLESATTVCGCGGGQSVAAVLPELLHRCRQLVLDADALNALAADPALMLRLRQRQPRGLATVLTPHPLEAARLLGISASAIQADRLGAASELAQRTGAVVLLKGSGTVIATAGSPPVVNGTGQARLAAPGTGDVLAGWLGAGWSAAPLPAGINPFDHAAQVAIAAAWIHGRAAGPIGPHGVRSPCIASALIDTMRGIVDRL